MSDTIKVMFFCLGNICRSPLAEGLFRHKVRERGLQDWFEIESSGTSSYHVGEPPDPGSQRVARKRLGLDISHQRSQQLSRQHVEEFDVLVAMDSSNQRVAQQWADGEDAVWLLRDFEPDPADRGTAVPDPWGGGGSQFDLVFDIVDRCCDVLLDELVDRHGLGA
jgi:protein-tyrosine phosphatase